MGGAAYGAAGGWPGRAGLHFEFNHVGASVIVRRTVQQAAGTKVRLLPRATARCESATVAHCVTALSDRDARAMGERAG
jgi:hypothetical protein